MILWIGSALAQEAEKGLRQRLGEPFRPLPLPSNRYTDTDRLKSLIREGRISLTLEDAIALAIENNLDVAVQRYLPLLAKTDSMRASAGGTLRAIKPVVREGPGGVGSPGGSTPTIGSDNSNNQAEGNLSLGQLPGMESGAFSSGPKIPSFDTTWNTQAGWNHKTALQTNPSSYGILGLVTDSTVFNTSLSKGFATGSQVALTFNNNRQRLNTGRIDYNPYTLSSLSLTFTQPLLQGFGTAVNRRHILVAANNEKIADYAFQQQLVATVSGVVRLYFDLVSLRQDVEVKRQAIRRSETLLENNRIQVEVGTLAPIEVVRAQAEVARNQQALTNAESMVLQQEVILKNFLSRRGTEDPELQRAGLVPLDTISVPENEELPALETLVEEAFRQRPDFLQTRLQLENAEIGLKGSRNALLPQLDLVASVQNNGLAGVSNTIPPPGTELPYTRHPDAALLGGYGSALGQIFRRNYPDYGIYLQLNIPLSNRQARADLLRDQVQRNQSELRLEQLKHQVRTELEAARIALQRARAGYQAARQARLLQEDAMQAEQEKYAVGATTSFFLIQYQRDLLQARSDEVLAQSLYAKARNALDRAAGSTLTRYRIKLEEAYEGRLSTRGSLP